MQRDCCAKLRELLESVCQLLGRRTSLPAHPTTTGVVVVSQTSGQSVPGKLTTLRLYSSTHVDPDTRRGKLTREASLKDGKKDGEMETVTYRVVFDLEPEFGVPGALAVKNGDKHEFFLKSVTLESPGSRSIHFDCNSWVFPNKKTNADRLFFSNTSYLPSKTPVALRELRQEELVSLRGDGTGKRKEWERVYDYDVYNDLGDPSKGQQHVRPVLGGSQAYPYPRRVRTGRPLSDIDRVTETRHKLINLDFYVPPDERFSPSKLSEFISNSIQAIVHFVIPEVKSLLEGNMGSFESFDQMTKDLYSGERNHAIQRAVMEKLKALLPDELFREITKAIKDTPIKFPVPQVIAVDESAWMSDEEFGREMLAGVNPAVIRSLETFPPVGRGGKQSSITAAHIENKLDGLTIQHAMDQWRIYILDHHDYLMPYIRRINNGQGVCMYASRTLLFLKDDATLKPLAIELSLPDDEEGREINRVFLPASEGTEAALWQLAKAHVAANDSGYHQLISHWLYTHATVEPFIIATRRQLSSMHPINKLLEPHFKDTMHINSLARSILLNADGILEKTMFPGKFCMELSSTIYESWNFNEQGLPADLLKRHLAVEAPDDPSGVRLLFEDYPYAVDGLDVWMAIKNWVSAFCAHFYADDAAVASDSELQTWWAEIQHIGHGDKREDPWTPLDSLPNLAETLTTLIWIASTLHASVNFGQYGYAGFPANRPPRCRRFIPYEGTPEFADLLEDPDKYFLETLPDRFTMSLGLALIEVLSRHTGDEVYLGRRGSAGWTDDEVVLRLFGEFGEKLRWVEGRIEERNRDPRLKNRWGPARVPYTLMYPDTENTGSEKGITGKGIPNSVSI